MRSLHQAALASALLTVGGLATLPSAHAQVNLLTNSGFESGDFNGWAVGPAGDLTVVSVASPDNYNAYAPHSGVYSAQFASSAVPDDVLSQTIATSAGETYTVSFWLANDDQGLTPENDFKVLFDGNSLLDLENANDFSYTHYQFTEAVTGAGSLLTFSGRQPPGAFYLDDINVTDAGPAAVPEASSVVSLGVLLTLGFGGLVWSARRRKSVSAE